MEERKCECEIDHEPRRQRSRPTVPFATLRQDLVHQLGRHPLRDQAQPYSLRYPAPRMHTPHNGATLSPSPPTQ